MSRYSKLPSLTVVVPVYNEADCLSFCLEQLLAQSRDVLEIIIVDNNSTDGSLNIARDYASKYNRVVVTRERNPGLVPARNRGFRLAAGDIVARIDADTRVGLGWARALRRHFADNPDVAAVSGQTHYYDLPFDNISRQISAWIINDCNQAISGFASLYGPNMAIRARLARKMARNSCSGDVNEDLDLTIHLIDGGYVVGSAPEAVAYISGRRLKSSPARFFKYCLNWPRTFRRHGDMPAASSALVLAILFCLGQAVIFLPLRAYDPEKLQLSWRRLVGYSDDRIIP